MFSQIKNNHVLRMLVTLGLTLITTVALLLGSVALHIPLSSPFALAHAAAATANTPASNTPQNLCASSPTAQNCDNQDPIAQHCDTSARTIAHKNIKDQQGTLLAKVERRYSATCHSYWGRIQHPKSSKRGIGVTILVHGRDVSASTITGTVAFTRMVFIPQAGTQMAELDGMASLNNQNPFDANVPTLLVIFKPKVAPAQK